MNISPMISLRNISKKFHLPRRKDETVLSILSQVVSDGTHQRRDQTFEAVSDISFDVQQGEVLGIIGKNASGKTTLLRIIAGIMQPDSGEVDVFSHVTSLINLSVGLQPRLLVRDNVYFACALLGMSREETHKKFNSIISFGALEKYVDMYPYQLSTGMNQRLAFSIAIHTEPEILLLDEVFSAGDISFQDKASKKMASLINSHVTVVMVSHDLKRIAKLSHKVLWLDNGRIKKMGDPSAVIKAYQESA